MYQITPDIGASTDFFKAALQLLQAIQNLQQLYLPWFRGSSRLAWWGPSPPFTDIIIQGCGAGALSKRICLNAAVRSQWKALNKGVAEPVEAS